MKNLPKCLSKLLGEGLESAFKVDHIPLVTLGVAPKPMKAQKPKPEKKTKGRGGTVKGKGKEGTEAPGTMGVTEATKVLPEVTDLPAPPKVDILEEKVEIIEEKKLEAIVEETKEIKQERAKIVPHYQTASAIQLFNRNKKEGSFGCNSCLELATKWKDAIPPNPLLSHVSLSQIGNGDPVKSGYFLNLFFNHQFIISQITNILHNGLQYPATKKLKVAIDFSSPNIAKDLHVGHLRSTIIGDSISRILEFQGHEVLRINHVGDWGTQFGMLTAHLYDKFPNFMEEKCELGELRDFYAAAKQEFGTNEEFKKRAKENVVLLQSGDAKIHSAWEYICDISRIQFQAIYDRLDVEIKEVGESFYNDKIPNVIAALIEKEVAIKNEGAMCVFVEGEKVPLIVQKSDGGYSYDSTDVAAIDYRLNKLNCDWLIYITDNGQQFHFKLLFLAAKKAGWYLPGTNRIDHMGFGLVLKKGGTKISTSEGGPMDRLMDLISEAQDRAFKQIKSRAGVTEGEVGGTFIKGDEESKTAAEIIGVAAIKYFDLKQNRITNYVFDYDRMLDPKGNTAVYLLYAYARICSIQAKAGMEGEKLVNLIETHPLTLTHPKEEELALALLRLPETIDMITEELQLNRMCDLIYEISGKLAEFYTQCKVIGSERENDRILLLEATRKVMKLILGLLGVKTIQRI